MTEVDGDVAFEDLVEGVSVAETPTSRPASPSAWSSTGAPASARPTCVRRSPIKDKDGGRSSSPAAARPATCCRWTRFSSVDPGDEVQAGDVPRPYPDAKAPRPATSPAVCRVWPNCSKPAVRRTRDHRRNLRRDRIRPRLQEQAPHHDRARRTRRRGGRVPDPEGQALPSSGRRLHRKGRIHHRRQSGAARHPGDQGRRGAGRLPRQRNPGGLPAAGRAHQRQAHRGDRPPDAAEGRDRSMPGDTDLLKGEQVDKLELDEINDQGWSPTARSRRRGNPVLLGITKASLQTRSLHLGGVVPGDHPRPHRGGRQRQGRIRSKASRRTSSSAA